MHSGSTPEVQFECGHRKHFKAPAPTQGDIVFCLGCGEYRKVISALEEQFRVKCCTCRFGRYYGTDIGAAKFSAGKHATYKQHKVGLFRGELLIAEIGPEGIDTRTQERLALSKQTQQLLKVFVTKP